MASDIKVSVKDDALRAAVDRVRLGLPLGGRMRPLWERIGRIGKTSTQLRFRTQVDPSGKPWVKSWRALNEGGQTMSLSRRLRNSIAYEARETGVAWGTNVAYAAQRNFGGVIRAKAGPFLSIPVTPEARRAGSPRNFGELHVAQSIKGQFMLVDKNGVTQYLLRAKVTQPAREFLGVNEADSKEIVDTSERYYEEQWR
ncbi:phage virion morphogenesis protein [Roseateles sp. DXS20W]|uniref:Phage virion morphogenesis protein n=1 Tax=Pelomonas lactea TaxID=3299030 RepID=A0ABW7GK19_9BURK